MLLFIVIGTFTEVRCFLVLKCLLVQSNLLLRMDSTWISRVSQKIRRHGHTWLLRRRLECLIRRRLLMNHPKWTLRRNSVKAICIYVLDFPIVSALNVVFSYLGRHSLNLDRYFVCEKISIVKILRVLYDVEIWVLIVDAFRQGIVCWAKNGLEFSAVVKFDVCFVLLCIVKLLNMIVWFELILVALIVVPSFHVVLGRCSEATAGQPWWVCL